MIDVTKPMRIFFATTNYKVREHCVIGDRIFVRPDLGSAYSWYQFDRNTGESLDRPQQRIANEPEPKRIFTKKLALIEYRDVVYAYTVTPDMEAAGLTAYLRSCIPGKCIAIKTVAFTEGEGSPPTY